jgi:hypothetical protein
MVRPNSHIRKIFNMPSAHSFDIEPLARFGGISAGIRRPKVCLSLVKVPIESRGLLTVIFRRLHASHTMNITFTAGMIPP